jgi:hypothetical protein
MEVSRTWTVRSIISAVAFWIEAAVFLSLIALTPYAISFQPFESVYEMGSYDAPHHEDPLYSQRTFTVTFGLIASAVCALCAFVGLAFNFTNRLRLVLQFSMAVCALVIGWRTFPYWVNGIHVVYTSDVSMGMQYNFDPKGLMPCSWTWGGIWYTGTLFLYPLVFIAVPFLMISTVRMLGRTGLNAATVISMAALLISLLMFLVTPGYFNWFMD